jgi:drug/metabolite transporter (DMT)-like permease
MKMKDFAALLGLAALWGASFLFIRIASPVFGPFLTIQGRVSIAAFALFLFLLLSKKAFYLKQKWKQYLMIGALNAAVPFTLIATAALYLPASLSSILNSLTPLFTALVIWGWMKEHLNIRKWVGTILGVIGVITLVGWSTITLTNEVILAIILSILSTISYGFAGVYAKKNFSAVPPLSLAFGQQLGASLLLLPFTFTQLPESTAQITSAAIWSVIGLALLCTALAYLLYFYLIENVGPTKTLSVTFLIPVFGIIWGSLFLKEEITTGIVAGLMIILGSVFFISDIQFKWGKRRIRREQTIR